MGLGESAALDVRVQGWYGENTALEVRCRVGEGVGCVSFTTGCEDVGCVGAVCMSVCV